MDFTANVDTIANMKNRAGYIGAIAALMLALSGLQSFAAVYEIGPGKTYVNINDFPWDSDTSLSPGDVVLIYYKATPYREKFFLCQTGSAAQPLTIRGVPDVNGNLPVIDGENATSRLMAGSTNIWGQNQAVLRIGEQDYPRNNHDPAYLVIENLEFANGHSDHTFTDTKGVAGTAYSTMAAGIMVRQCNNLIIRNCAFRDCCNGITTIAATPSVTNMVLEGCYFYNNGDVGYTGPHSVYIQGGVVGMTAQYCRFGPPLTGAPNNSYKDRASRTVFRYNWIEEGSYNLALVEGECPGVTGDSGYNTAYVYGNVMYVTDLAGSKVMRFGGDLADTAVYKTTLHFYNNTLVSKRSLANRTRIFSTWVGATIDARNNIFYTEAGGASLAIMSSSTGDGTDGTINLRNNWLSTGWSETFDTGDKTAPGVIPVSGNISGTSPGFFNYAGGDYSLTSVSACKNVGTALNASVLPTYNVTNEYVKHRTFKARASDATFDIGAYEYATPVTAPVVSNGAGATAITATNATLRGNLVSTGNAPTQVWIYYGTGDGGTTKISWATNKALGIMPQGLFSNVVSGLVGSTLYYYRCYASNSAGGAWAPASSNFTTLTAVSPPTVDNGAGAANITTNKATLRGTLLTTGGAPCQAWIYWGIADGGTTKVSWATNKALGAMAQGSFSNVTSNLVSGTLYYYRCYASNSAGGAWAPASSNFTTIASADSDGDGILDSWEMSNFGNLTNATAVSDNDGDGFLDWEEAQAGTGPMNTNDLLSVGCDIPGNTNAPVVSWSSVAGKVYSVTRATNLMSGVFSPVYTNFSATSSVSIYTDTNAPAVIEGFFYRIKLN